MRLMSAGDLLTAAADRAVMPMLPAKYMYVDWILSFTYWGQILKNKQSHRALQLPGSEWRAAKNTIKLLNAFVAMDIREVL